MASEQDPPETPGLEILDLTETRIPSPSAAAKGSNAAGGKGGNAGRVTERSAGRPAARTRTSGTPVNPDEPREAKSSPPTAMEWQDFIGGTVLRLLTEGYLQLVLFRDIDESDLTERERELVRLDKDDLRDIAAPMASFAAKSKVTRKHGRVIIAAGDSYESLIDLFIWMRRVNKIARKYRKDKPAKTIKGTVSASGQVPGQDTETGDYSGPYLYNPGTG